MEEEDARVFTKQHLVQQHYNAKFQANPTINKGKTCSHLYLKFVFIALFLCLIPLFPSEPPEFISDTIFAKTWELIHLLFIGIALSYGLFCRPKTPHIPPKTQVSQPYAPNILHHTSLFDYEEGTPSGVNDRKPIPTQSFKLSHYREEPVAVSSRKSSRNFDDRPLGLPVRSLKSRVVDSDSEELEQEEEEDCASDCDSYMSGSNSCSSSEKDEILEGNVDHFSLNSGKSQSMRGEYFMAGNGKFEGKQSDFAAGSCQKISGFCSWLPQSPNMDFRDNDRRENNYYMPFTNYNRVNDFNVMGMSPNLQNNTNYFMPPAAAVHPSMPFSASNFASNWGNVNFGNGASVENPGLFTPPTAVPSSMPIPATNFASRSRRYNPETEIWSKSPNMQNETLGGGNSNHYMPSAVFPPAVPPSTDASAPTVEASKYGKFNNGFSLENKDEIRSEYRNAALGGENEHWGNANFGNGNMSVENSGFFISPTAVPSSKSIPANEFASRSRRYTQEAEKWSKSPNLQNNVTGGINPNLAMPSAAFLPRVPASADASASSVEASKNAKFSNGFPLMTKDEVRSENSNVPMVGGNVNTVTPSAAVLPSMPTSTDDNASLAKASRTSKMPTSSEDYASLVKSSWNAKFNHGSSLSSNVALGGENTNTVTPSAAFPPSMPTSTDDNASLTKPSKNSKMPTSKDYASSVKASRNAKFNHGSSLSSNVALGGENTNIVMPPATCLPSKPDSANDSASSVEAFKNAKFNHGSSLKKKDEMRSENNNVVFGEDNRSFPIPSAAMSPTMSASTDDFASSIREPKSANLNRGSSLKKKDKIRSKGNKVVAGGFQEGTKSCTPTFEVPLSSKLLKLENENSGVEKSDSLMNTTEVLPSVPAPPIESASLVKKDENISEDVESFVEKNKSDTPHVVDPFSFTTDVLPKNNEQGSIPEKWGDDCFVIPSSGNNAVGDILLENLPPITNSEASSLAESSSRKSSHEQESPQNKVEDIPSTAPRNNSEIEHDVKDNLGENDSYKPSTPSPPPRLQTRRNELVTSSVESSSRAFGNQSLLNDNDDLGSPPTPERRKTLTRTSHSRRFSCGYFFDRDLRKSFKDEAKETNKKTKGDDDQFARGGKCGWDCLKLDVKPALNRAALKGKSVRTIKPKETAPDQQKNNQIELKHQEYIEGLSVANGGEITGEKPETVFIKIGIREKRSNSNGRKGEKLLGDGGTTSIILGLNSKEKSNGTTVVPVLNDVKEERIDSEIDRKADEFIAKFKQQIRLQKIGPGGDPSRQHKQSLYRT